MNRRDMLRLLLASAAAEAVDFERLLWTPRPILTVPATSLDWTKWLHVVRSPLTVNGIGEKMLSSADYHRARSVFTDDVAEHWTSATAVVTGSWIVHGLHRPESEKKQFYRLHPNRCILISDL